MTTVLTVERAGLQTLIVDGGRVGYAHLGVPRSGALDPASLERANTAVGNTSTAAGLECLLRGPLLSAPGRQLAAVAPGFLLRGEGELDLRKLPTLRMWIAISGGVESPMVLCSRSADLLGGIGPGPLSDGDWLPLGISDGGKRESARMTLPMAEVRTGPLAVASGPDKGDVEPGPWIVQPNSDRTALRLSRPGLDRPGQDGAATPHGLQARTRGLVAGAIQLPPDGRPVVFLAGHPATGGYPIIGFVADADLPRLAQVRPGHTVEFGWPRPKRVQRRAR